MRDNEALHFVVDSVTLVAILAFLFGWLPFLL